MSRRTEAPRMRGDPPVEEKKSDEDHHGGEEAAQAVGGGMAVPGTSTAVVTVAPTNDPDGSSPAADDSGAEQKETDNHAVRTAERRRSNKGFEVAKTVWKNNIHPKIKNSVPDTDPTARSHVQMIAYVLIVAFFLLAMLWAYMTEHCDYVTTLRATFTALGDDSSTCCDILVPQEFSGQPYYEPAYYWGFAVHAAWGTFRGGNWTSYCSGLLRHAAGGVPVVEDLSSYSTSATQYDLEPYSFKGIDGTSTIRCHYWVHKRSDLQTLPKAPGGAFGCSYPANGTAYSSPYSCTLDGEELIKDDYSKIWAWVFVDYGEIGDIEGDFCPDFMLWGGEFVHRSPLDEEAAYAEEAIDKICSMWGQDVGIVSKVVQNCTQKICKKWWAIVANAIAIALGAEVVWIFGALGVYSLYHKWKQHRKDNGDDPTDLPANDPRARKGSRRWSEISQDTEEYGLSCCLNAIMSCSKKN